MTGFYEPPARRPGVLVVGDGSAVVPGLTEGESDDGATERRMTGFFEMSPEVAAAAADLYRVKSPRFACACGWWSFSANEHSQHRTGGAAGSFGHENRAAAGGCQATWVKP